MMNARERRDLEELRAYYNKIQKAIEKMQGMAKKAEGQAMSAENNSIQQHMGVAAFASYSQCVKMLLEE